MVVVRKSFGVKSSVNSNSASTFVFLMCFGVFWCVLVCSGVFWCVLVCFGVFWCIVFTIPRNSQPELK
jgi:hypothetical protein